MPVCLAAALAASTSVASAAPFKRLFTVRGTVAQAAPFTRTPDGRLHLVFQTLAGQGISGLGSISISPKGSVGPQWQALGGWQAGQPGLVTLPGKRLEAFFGATAPGPGASSVWGITSIDGGVSWSAPTDVKGGGPNESLAEASNVSAAMLGITPILSLPQAGTIVIQRGLGLGSPSYPLTNAAAGSTTDADLATDVKVGEVVAGWPSIAGALRDYIQGAAPVGALQLVPGQYRNQLELAGRDFGPGVFAPYTPDGTHVRLLRYNGGSVAVGSRRGVAAQRLGVATGPHGRIWVMWGDDSSDYVAVTRSNKTDTRFEPVQRLKTDAFTLYRLSGDGRLGPLDLLLDEIPNSRSSVPPPGEYYAHVLPVFAASPTIKKVKNKKNQVIAHKLTVRVTDAGDPISGAKVTVNGTSKVTGMNGVAILTVKGTGSATMTVTDPSYHQLKQPIHLG
jgi:hypothetical protein